MESKDYIDIIRDITISLSKKYGIQDRARLFNILEETSTDLLEYVYLGDSDIYDVVRITPFYGLYFYPNLPDLLEYLPPDIAMDLIEKDPEKAMLLLNYVFPALSSENIFFTHDELAQTLYDFIEYLKSNQDSLIRTGFPKNVFNKNLWLYYHFSSLCPLKIAASFRMIKSNRNYFKYEPFKIKWLLHKKEKYSEIESFEDASYIDELSSYEIDETETLRPKILEVKIALLKTLSKLLLSKDYNPFENIYEKLFEIVGNSISQKEFYFLNSTRDRIRKSLKEVFENKLSSMYIFPYPSYTAGSLNELGFLTQYIKTEKIIKKHHNLKTRLNRLREKLKIDNYFLMLTVLDKSEIRDILKQATKETTKFRLLLLKIDKKSYVEAYNRKLKIDFSIKQDYKGLIEIVELIEKSEIPGFSINFIKQGLKASGKRRIIPLELPSETKWHEITIQFIDNEYVKIKEPNHPEDKINYVKMGFEDRKKLCPNSQWKFLQFLSLQGGRQSLESLAEKCRLTKPDDIKKLINQAKKRKQLLSKALKEYFHIDEDPFYDYRKRKAYEVKFNLFPQEHLQE